MEPQFEGQTKTKLGNNDVKGIVDSLVYEGFKNALDDSRERDTRAPGPRSREEGEGPRAP